MKREILLPSGVLGVFGKDARIKIELDMLAKHFDLLSTVSEDTDTESVVLDILSDLVDGVDVWCLAKIDMEYLFTLVKAVSMGDGLTISSVCRSLVQVSKGAPLRMCGERLTYKVKIMDSDVKVCDLDERPRVTLEIDGEERQFDYRLPTMREEIDLINDFVSRGYSRKDIVSEEHRDIMLEYAKCRMLLHLDPAGFTRERLRDVLSSGSFRLMVNLTRQIDSMGKYGLVHKTYHQKCPSCGGDAEARLPLLGGISL